jgi:hypothetical protein
MYLQSGNLIKQNRTVEKKKNHETETRRRFMQDNKKGRYRRDNDLEETNQIAGRTLRTKKEQKSKTQGTGEEQGWQMWSTCKGANKTNPVEN